jgi:hypothetical protein
LAVLAVVLAWMKHIARFRRAGDAYYWPWLDVRRGDRAQQAYVAEMEMPRIQERDRPRDLAP